MTRSKKKAGPSTRKQPVQRRARNRTVRRSTAPSTSLRKVPGRSSPPPAKSPSSDQSRSSDELPTLRLRAITLPEDGHSASPTERPVARTLPPPAEAQVEAGAQVEIEVELDPEVVSPTPPTVAREKSSTPPWLLALAAIVAGSVIWVALGNSGSKSSNSVVSSGKPDTQLSESPVAAAPPVAEPAPPAEAQPEVVIDLDEPQAPRATTRRLLSARPAAKAAVVERSQAAVGPFDQTAADSELTAAAEQASSCRQAGDPTGVAKVVVTFAPSGRVTSASISGPPFAGTQTGSCIAKTMRGMSLPAFEGKRMTISKTVVIM